MKSVKPGRAPSFVSALVAFFMAIIGVAFTVEAFSVSILRESLLSSGPASL